MTVKTAIESRRSIRRFLPKDIPEEILSELLDEAALYASGGNRQPIRYIVVHRDPLREKVFECTKWAMYLPDFRITEEQRPAAYILLLSGNENAQFDCGAAATTIMLGAREFGLDTCCLGALNREKLSGILPVPEDMHILLTIALGYAAQSSRIVPFAGSCEYYETDDGFLNVPKYSKDDLVLFSDT